MSIDRSLHKYSLCEELISAISHGLGAILSLIGGIFICIKASSSSSLIMFSFIIYTISMVTLYSVSTIYHSLAPNNAKKVFRILDHCSVYLLIVGTYAPFCVAGIKGKIGLLIFLGVLITSVVGIILTAIDMKKFSKFCFACYIITGWIIILAIKPLITSLNTLGLWLLISGGLAYTIGALIYLAGGKIKYMHSIWHFFVLAGSILHFFSLYLTVL